MASRDNINTVTSIADNATDQDQTPVTGTTVQTTKRAMDSYVWASNLASTHALLNIILGRLPFSDFDQIKKTTNTNGSETFVFSYQGTSLFQVDITDPQEDYMIKINNLAVSGSIILMDGTGSMTDIAGNDYVLVEA